MASVATKPFRAAAKPLRAAAGWARTLAAPFRRRYRAHSTAPTASLVHTPHPYWRSVGLVAVAVLGAWLGLLVVGASTRPSAPSTPG